MPTYDCPTCRKLFQVARREEALYRPFCSHRCQMIDLGKWLAEEYRISEPLEIDLTAGASPDDAPQKHRE